MNPTTEMLLKVWNDAIAAERAANSQVAAAASLFCAGKIGILELERFSKKADAAERMCNEAYQDYRKSYQK